MYRDMKKPNKSFIFKYQYTPCYRRIGNESITVPDLVLSMREVYQKYVMTGSIEGLAVSPLVQDDRLMDDFPDETVDTLLMSKNVRDSAYDELRGKTKGLSGQEDKPQEKEDSDESSPKPQDPEAKPEDVTDD